MTGFRLGICLLSCSVALLHNVLLLPTLSHHPVTTRPISRVKLFAHYLLNYIHTYLYTVELVDYLPNNQIIPVQIYGLHRLPFNWTIAMLPAIAAWRSVLFPSLLPVNSSLSHLFGNILN